MLKGLKIITQILFLYVFYLIGSWIQSTFTLPIPGSIIGMILLFIFLLTNVIHEKWVKEGANWMVSHLVLFIIPATVGIMNFFSFFKGKGLLLILIVLVSTAMVLISTGFSTQWIIRRKKDHI